MKQRKRKETMFTRKGAGGLTFLGFILGAVIVGVVVWAVMSGGGA